MRQVEQWKPPRWNNDSCFQFSYIGTFYYTYLYPHFICFLQPYDAMKFTHKSIPQHHHNKTIFRVYSLQLKLLLLLLLLLLVLGTTSYFSLNGQIFFQSYCKLGQFPQSELLVKDATFEFFCSHQSNCINWLLIDNRISFVLSIEQTQQCQQQIKRVIQMQLNIHTYIQLK